jgi:hypothetical protein
MVTKNVFTTEIWSQKMNYGKMATKNKFTTEIWQQKFRIKKYGHLERIKCPNELY